MKKKAQAKDWKKKGLPAITPMPLEDDITSKIYKQVIELFK